MRGSAHLRNFMGLVVIMIGAAWLLNNLGAAHIPIWSYLIKLWPLFLVVFGWTGFSQALKHPISMLGAVVNLGILCLGLLLIAGNYGFIDLDLGDVFSMFFPAVIILLGISLLQSPKMAFQGSTQFAVMSGLELKNKEPFELKDQNLVAIMGGGEVDLTNARFVQNETTITCLAIMGGWNIRVPMGVRVEFSGSTFLGGIEAFGESTGGIVAHKAMTTSDPAHADEAAPLLRIHAQALLGGVEIRRV